MFDVFLTIFSIVLGDILLGFHATYATPLGPTRSIMLHSLTTALSWKTYVSST